MDRQKQGEYYQKIKIKEEWGKKHNLDIDKKGINDWRTTFKFLVDSPVKDRLLEFSLSSSRQDDVDEVLSNEGYDVTSQESKTK